MFIYKKPRTQNILLGNYCQGVPDIILDLSPSKITIDLPDLSIRNQKGQSHLIKSEPTNLKEWISYHTIFSNHMSKKYRILIKDNDKLNYSDIQKKLNKHKSTTLDLTSRDGRRDKITGWPTIPLGVKKPAVKTLFSHWIKDFINILNDKISTYCEDNKNFINRDLPQTRFEIYNSYVDNNLQTATKIAQIYDTNTSIFQNAVLEFVAFELDILDESYIDQLTDKLLKLLHSVKFKDIQTESGEYSIIHGFHIETSNGFWNKLFNPRFKCICRIVFCSKAQDSFLILTDRNPLHVIKIIPSKRFFKKSLNFTITQIPGPEYNIAPVSCIVI